MSKGSPIVPIRIPADLLAEIESLIAEQEQTRAAEPWTRTSWIVKAIREKLAHVRRSRAKKLPKSS